MIYNAILITAGRATRIPLGEHPDAISAYLTVMRRADCIGIEGYEPGPANGCSADKPLFVETEGAGA